MQEREEECRYCIGIMDSLSFPLSMQMASSAKNKKEKSFSTNANSTGPGVLQSSPSYPATEMLFLQGKLFGLKSPENCFLIGSHQALAQSCAFSLTPHLAVYFSLQSPPEPLLADEHQVCGLHGRIMFCDLLVLIPMKISLIWGFL